MTTTLTIEREVHFQAQARGRKALKVGPEPPRPAPDPGRVPRVARLMALALRFEGLLKAGVVKDYAELARLGHVSRARVSQVMNLLSLSPDLQEAVLFLPRTRQGRDPIPLWRLQPIAAALDWRKQRRLWAGLHGR
jgi:hypothetical protein